MFCSVMEHCITPFRFQTTQKNSQLRFILLYCSLKTQWRHTVLYNWTMQAFICFNCLYIIKNPLTQQVWECVITEILWRGGREQTWKFRSSRWANNFCMRKKCRRLPLSKPPNHVIWQFYKKLASLLFHSLTGERLQINFMMFHVDFGVSKFTL